MSRDSYLTLHSPPSSALPFWGILALFFFDVARVRSLFADGISCLDECWGEAAIPGLSWGSCVPFHRGMRKKEKNSQKNQTTVSTLSHMDLCFVLLTHWIPCHLSPSACISEGSTQGLSLDRGRRGSAFLCWNGKAVLVENPVQHTGTPSPEPSQEFHWDSSSSMWTYYYWVSS